MKQGRKINRVLKLVWYNEEGKRYIPRALNPGVDYSWGVWDRRNQRFVNTKDLVDIEASESFLE